MAGQYRKLDRVDLERLKYLKSARQLNVQQLRLAMPSAPFRWSTLQNALDGKALRKANYDFLIEWLDRYMARPADPPERLIRSGKDASAGDDDNREERSIARLRSESEVES